MRSNANSMGERAPTLRPIPKDVQPFKPEESRKTGFEQQKLSEIRTFKDNGIFHKKNFSNWSIYKTA
jgi:hypothetical protein